MLLQVISPTVNSSGAISADWVLVLCCSIIGVLLLIIFNDIRNSIKNLVQRVSDQEKQITKTTERVEYAHERIEELKQSIQQ